MRIIVIIAGKALLDGSLDRQIARERGLERGLAELARKLRDSDKA